MSNLLCHTKEIFALTNVAIVSPRVPPFDGVVGGPRRRRRRRRGRSVSGVTVLRDLVLVLLLVRLMMRLLLMLPIGVDGERIRGADAPHGPGPRTVSLVV